MRPDSTEELIRILPEGVDFANLGEISALDVYGNTKQAFLHNPKVDGILYLSCAMRVGSIIKRVEQDLGLRRWPQP